MDVKGSISYAGTLVFVCALSSGAAAYDQAATWTKKASIPVGMAEVGVTALDGKLYVVGGTEVKGQAAPKWDSTLNMMYDPARDTWEQRAPLPQGLSHVGVAALGGKLYAIGGFTNIVHMGPQDLAFVYDPKMDRWTALPKLSSPRGSVAVAALDGKLHIFGGRDSSKVVKISPPGRPDMFAGFGTITTHEIFDPATQTWSRGSPVPAPARDHMGIVVLDGKIHLFGGRVADVVDNLDRHDVYDPKSDRWSAAAPLPRPRSSGAYTVLQGQIIYAGGECKPGGQPFTTNAYEDVTAYDPRMDHWTTLNSLPGGGRHAFGAATIGDVAYFAGGAQLCGGGTSTDMLALTLL
jgi:N-acetylneuraminic acid mutarotase